MTQIYAPNVHLFTFHLAEKNNPEHLWNYYNQTIKTAFHLSLHLEPRPSPLDIKAYLTPNEASGVFLLFNGKLSAKSPVTDITGIACPVLIYDSYALALNLRIPEKDEQNQPTKPVNLAVFKEFNPQQVLRPEKVNSNLGQTLLLTAWLLPPEQKQREQWQKIAHNILKEFLHDEYVPPLYQASQLFGSPIFEYGSPKHPNSQGKIEHYLVWLFLDSTADENLGYFYQQLIDLWLYRQKITTAYQQSRADFAKVKAQYQEIKNIFSEIPQHLNVNEQSARLSTSDLTYLKTQLKKLPKLDLEYMESLSSLKNWHSTLSINHHNYKEKITNIQDKATNHDLSFLSSFGTKNAATLKTQIEDDLSYFDQGSNWADKGINTIRGLVEIDQAEANQDLQDQIQAVGVGIAAGAIVASTSGLITQPWYLPNGQKIQLPCTLPHPFLMALVGSIICSLGAWWWTKREIQKRRSLPKESPNPPKATDQP
ncbi:hypothetical protein [Spirulina subsalsa]|uniref:hypothetical protein n=1 Tax=Spirulina subsalsa TaxID=54311 RepID=UPI0002E1A135|nr:hypothetical protein [Spirulina subsalsa]